MKHQPKIHIDVLDFLTKLKIQNISQAGSEVNFSCPFDGHQNGDRHPSARMNVNTTAWICHGCKRTGNAVSFLSDLENVSKGQAVSWINNRWLNPLPDSKSLLQEIDEMIDPDTQLTLLEGPFRPSQDHINALLVEAKALAANHDISHKTSYYKKLTMYMNYHHLDYSIFSDGFFGNPHSECLYIPIYSHEHILVGYKARSFMDNTNKFVIMYPTYPKSRVLATYSKTTHINNSGILCESELDALRLQQGGYEAYALGGSDMSYTQEQIILDEFDTILIFMDNDKPGVQATLDIGRRLSRKLSYCGVIHAHHFTNLKDPCDIPQTQLRSVMSRHIPFTEFELIVSMNQVGYKNYYKLSGDLI